MDRADSVITLDTPSCLLRNLGVKGDLLLLPVFPGSIHRLFEASRIVPVNLLDDVIRHQEEDYRILRQELQAWGLIRLQDPVGSIVTCIGFHFDPHYDAYFCEVSLEQPMDDPFRRLLLSSFRLAPHKLLAFQDLLLL